MWTAQKYLLLVIFCGLQLCFGIPIQNTEADIPCSYQTCNPGEPGMINVHLVPHTHDDVGWLKTVDQYYYGAKTDIQRASVNLILDTVIQALRDDKDRRFIYVEIAFFKRWWDQQSDFLRHAVKGLVNEGRLQFILGGWSMNDEAATHYNSIIDQHTVGFKFLEDNFGECGKPHVGWQIDPFGHSREQASLFAQFGFDGLFFGRLDQQDKDTRLSNKTMEMMWYGSESLGDQASLFTGVNYNGYNPPGGFCFDSLCNDEPIMDDSRLHDYNVEQRVADFLSAVENQARSYSTNHIMMTMGSDFQFSNAHANFKQLDKLIKYVNQKKTNGSKVNAFYSNPNCYLLALNKQNQSYTSKSDDFFPYAHRDHSFWTGYFTSRPSLKKYERDTNNFLQVCKQLDVLADIENDFSSNFRIDILRQAMGVLQHHDAVSGTEKQAVADDYAERAANGRKECADVINKAMSILLPKSNVSTPNLIFCPMSNITMCNATEGVNNFTLVMYNPVGRPVTTNVRVPVSGSSFTVLDKNGTPVKNQVVPMTNITAAIPERNGSRANADLVFKATLPALGFSTFFVTKTGSNKIRAPLKIRNNQPFDIKNEHIKLSFDGSGLLKTMTNLDKSISITMQQSLQYYHSMPGNNSDGKFQASGAYIFRPNGSVPKFEVEVSVENSLVQGVMVQEVHQRFNNFSSQVIRLYAGAKHAEFEWTVGPIPIEDGIGKEVISLYSTNLQNGKTFYTDANGREVLKRVRDFRPTWKLNQTEPVAGNYYPINSRIFIQDTKKNVQFTVLTDRSQGGGSIRNGQVEVMVHRRILNDDSLGVGENLNETGADGKGLIARGTHYVILDTIEASSALHRDLSEKLYMAPLTGIAKSSLSAGDYAKAFNVEWSGFSASKSLPDNVHLLTLEGWRKNNILLRLEHMYQKDEDQNLSKPTTVSLKNLFDSFEIEEIHELTLGANSKLETAKRLKWNVQGHGETKSDMSSFVTPINQETLDIVLNPMQIRTFEVTFKSSKLN